MSSITSNTLVNILYSAVCCCFSLHTAEYHSKKNISILKCTNKLYFKCNNHGLGLSWTNHCSTVKRGWDGWMNTREYSYNRQTDRLADCICSLTAITQNQAVAGINQDRLGLLQCSDCIQTVECSEQFCSTF